MFIMLLELKNNATAILFSRCSALLMMFKSVISNPKKRESFCLLAKGIPLSSHISLSWCFLSIAMEGNVSFNCQPNKICVIRQYIVHEETFCCLDSKLFSTVLGGKCADNILCHTPHCWRKFLGSFAINYGPPSIDISTWTSNVRRRVAKTLHGLGEPDSLVPDLIWLCLVQPESQTLPQQSSSTFENGSNHKQLFQKVLPVSMVQMGCFWFGWCRSVAGETNQADVLDATSGDGPKINGFGPFLHTSGSLMSWM